MVEITLIPKKEEFRLPIQDIAAIAAAGLFILSLIIGGMLVLYKNNLTGNLTNFENSLKELRAQRDPDLEQKLVSLKKKTNGAKPLLESHIFTTNIFKFLEENTLPNVQIGSAKINFEQNSLDFLTKAPNFVVAGQQLYILKNNPSVVDVNIPGINLNNEGGVDFDVKIIFRSELVRLNSAE